MRHVLTAALEEYLREVASQVPQLAARGSGGEILGTVPGRPATEDLELGVDRTCEEIFASSLRKTGLRLEVHSEHGLWRVGGEGTPQYLVALDPFDGSGLFRRGLPAEWWSVATVYDLERRPLAGGAVDILRRELYLADRDGVTLIALADEARTPISPSPKTVLDDVTVLAAYLMGPSYLGEWAGQMQGLLEQFPAILVWPNGGSCIYPWIARGLVHGYVMFNEPRSEIDPGLAFAWAAGYPVVSLGKAGDLEPYRFIPGKQAERVPVLIAACTEELARRLAGEIML